MVLLMILAIATLKESQLPTVLTPIGMVITLITFQLRALMALTNAWNTTSAVLSDSADRLAREVIMVKDVLLEERKLENEHAKTLLASIAEEGSKRSKILQEIVAKTESTSQAVISDRAIQLRAMVIALRRMGEDTLTSEDRDALREAEKSLADLETSEKADMIDTDTDTDNDESTQSKNDPFPLPSSQSRVE